MTSRYVLTLILLAALPGCSQRSAEEVDSETVVPVSTEPATTGSIRATITVTGTVTAAPDADQLVVAPMPARITEIPFAEGDRVRVGDILVRFEIPSLGADVASRGADVARARARLENATASRTRAHDLFDRGIAARKEMEDADRELADAEAGVAEAAATLAAAETAAGRATIRARFNGVVARRLHNPGDLVDASSGDPVLRVIDPRRLEVTASVPIPDVPRIVVGATARMATATGGDDIQLKVVSRPTAVEPGTATVPVRLSFTAPAATAVGTPVQVTIDAEEHRDVVLVPAEAVVHEGNEAAVFVVSNDKAVRRVITLGLTDAAHAEVRDGVKAGEPVIVKGQAGLPDGAVVSVNGAGPAKGDADK